MSSLTRRLRPSRCCSSRQRWKQHRHSRCCYRRPRWREYRHRRCLPRNWLPISRWRWCRQAGPRRLHQSTNLFYLGNQLITQFCIRKIKNSSNLLFHYSCGYKIYMRLQNKKTLGVFHPRAMLIDAMLPTAGSASASSTATESSTSSITSTKTTASAKARTTTKSVTPTRITVMTRRARGMASVCVGVS